MSKKWEEKDEKDDDDDDDEEEEEEEEDEKPKGKKSPAKKKAWFLSEQWGKKNCLFVVYIWDCTTQLCGDYW